MPKWRACAGQGALSVVARTPVTPPSNTKQSTRVVAARADRMTGPFSVLCLFLTVGTLLGLGPETAQYRREDYQFTNRPKTKLSKIRFRIDCSAKCTAMKQWFCGGFTYHDDGTCELYEGTAVTTCVNPLDAAPPLTVGSKRPQSYRRLNSTCPGQM